jgi:dTDP-4-dehydrorhamnose 3,5-epimerase
MDGLTARSPALKFTPTEVDGVLRVSADPARDARGLFARLYCPAEFATAGLGDFHPTQMNLSRNTAARTLRGMHLQAPPHAEAKLVRVVKGLAFDVALDLRPDSPTYRCWTAAVLDGKTMEALFIPEGCAHGFLTLESDTDVLYQMGRPYEPGFGRGVRWDDPAFRIAWPAQPAVIEPRDTAWPAWLL